MENPHKALAGLVFDKDTVSASKMVPVTVQKEGTVCPRREDGTSSQDLYKLVSQGLPS